MHVAIPQTNTVAATTSRVAQRADGLPTLPFAALVPAKVALAVGAPPAVAPTAQRPNLEAA